MRFTLSTLAQPCIFAAFIYTGILIGVIFTVFGAIKRAFKKSRAVNIAAEIACCVVSGALIMYVLYDAVSFRLRFYYIYGLAAGFLLYSAAIFPLAGALRQKLTKKNVDKRSKNDCNIPSLTVKKK